MHGSKKRWVAAQVRRWRARFAQSVGALLGDVSPAAQSLQIPGLGFPLARLVAIVSLSRGAVLEWAIGPWEGKETGETALLRQLALRPRRGAV